MKKVYFLYILVVLIILSLTHCYPDKPGKMVAHMKNHAEIDSFYLLSRSDQIRKCGSCHQREYENELLGPHSNSFLRLSAHVMFVNSDYYDSEEYKNYIKIKVNVCVGCHATPNLYETLLHTANQYPDSLQSYLDQLGPPLKTRGGDPSLLITGDDCLTCHFDGKRVVTNAQFDGRAHEASPPYCSPRGSNLFSSNNNCVTCHQEEVQTITALPNTISTETSCIKCHQQYDAQGNGTHYIYWRNDSRDKPKPDRLILFNDISAYYNESQKEVIIKWLNTRLPHLTTRASEILADFEVINKNDEVLGKGEIRLNRSKVQNEYMQQFWGDKPIPGVSGYNLPLDGTGLYDTINNIVTSKDDHLRLRITGSQKTQYWFPDSFKVVNFHKLLEL